MDVEVSRLRCRGVLLDLDGTLVDTTQAVEAAWRRLAEDIGLPWEALQHLAHGIPAGQVIQQVAPWLQASSRSQLATRLLNDIAGSDAAVTLLPGAQALISALDGAPWGIVTSGNLALATSSLDKVGVHPPVLVTADDVTTGKPDPTPFILGAQRIGVAATECIVIEDSPAGVTSGIRAQMRVIAISHTHAAKELADASFVLRALPQVHRHSDGVLEFSHHVMAGV